MAGMAAVFIDEDEYLGPGMSRRISNLAQAWPAGRREHPRHCHDGNTFHAGQYHEPAGRDDLDGAARQMS